jgi:hypothetical protein
MSARDSYTIDTSILIDLEQRYPRDVFPSAWEALEALIDERRACICSEVLEEVKRGTDDLYDWARGYTGFTCPLTDDDIAVAAQISDDYPDWVRADKNAADPFLIAHGQIDKRIVVTDERRSGPGASNRNLKVPNIADVLRVRTMTFVEFARGEGWRF